MALAPSPMPLTRSSSRFRSRASSLEAERPTFGSCPTAGAATTSRRPCWIRFTRPTKARCCLWRPPATTASRTTSCRIIPRATTPQMWSPSRPRPTPMRARASRTTARPLCTLARRAWMCSRRCDGNTYGFSSGTSMAAPHVSGAGALALSHCTLNTAELKATLVDSVDVIPSMATTTISGGRLNVRRALESCSAPPSAPTSLSAIGGDKQVKLNWPAATNASSYRVKRSTTSGGPYTLVASNIKTLQYIDTGLVNGTTYYYVVSAANVRGESAISPEASATPTLPADLIVSAFTVPASAAAGSTLAVTATTRNQGTGSAGESTTRFYISTNTVVDALDVHLLEVHAVPSLAPGVSATASISLGIPSDLGAGNYYVIAKADADDVLWENQEGNNTSARALKVGPDLIVSALTVPAAAAEGAPIIATYTVRNQGTSQAAASTLRFFWSVNTSIRRHRHGARQRESPADQCRRYRFRSSDADDPGRRCNRHLQHHCRGRFIEGRSGIKRKRITAWRELCASAAIWWSPHSMRRRPVAPVCRFLSAIRPRTPALARSKHLSRISISHQMQCSRHRTRRLEHERSACSHANQASTGVTPVTIPTGTPVGLYYLFAKADGDDLVSRNAGRQQQGRSILHDRAGPDRLNYAGPVADARRHGRPRKRYRHKPRRR